MNQLTGKLKELTGSDFRGNLKLINDRHWSHDTFHLPTGVSHDSTVLHGGNEANWGKHKTNTVYSVHFFKAKEIDCMSIYLFILKKTKNAVFYCMCAVCSVGTSALFCKKVHELLLRCCPSTAKHFIYANTLAVIITTFSPWNLKIRPFPNGMGRFKGTKCSWLHTTRRNSNLNSNRVCIENKPQLRIMADNKALLYDFKLNK